MLRLALVAAAAAAALSGPVVAQAADGASARNLAATCTSCHGTDGVSQGPIPSLAGLPKADVVRKLQDFKSGREAGTIMPQLAKGYSDEQIDLIAGWFAAQTPPKAPR